MSGLSGVTAISAGPHHSLALRGDGTVWACGLDGAGRILARPARVSNDPTRVVPFRSRMDPGPVVLPESP